MKWVKEAVKHYQQNPTESMKRARETERVFAQAREIIREQERKQKHEQERAAKVWRTMEHIKRGGKFY